MSQHYRLYKNVNIKSEFYGKTYGRAMYLDTVTTEQVIERIEASCTLTGEDFAACIRAFVKQINMGLQDGKRVKLDGLGTFKVGLRTTYADKPEEFTAKGNVKGMRVIFEPEKKMQGGKRTTSLLNGVKVAELSTDVDARNAKPKNSQSEPQNP